MNSKKANWEARREEGGGRYRSNGQELAQRADQGLGRRDSGVQEEHRVEERGIVWGCRGVAAEKARVRC